MKIIFGKDLLPDECIAVICLTFTLHIKNQSGLNYNLRCCAECCTPISTSSSWIEVVSNLQYIHKKLAYKYDDITVCAMPHCVIKQHVPGLLVSLGHIRKTL